VRGGGKVRSACEEGKLRGDDALVGRVLRRASNAGFPERVARVGEKKAGGVEKTRLRERKGVCSPDPTPISPGKQSPSPCSRLLCVSRSSSSSSSSSSSCPKLSSEISPAHAAPAYLTKRNQKGRRAEPEARPNGPTADVSFAPGASFASDACKWRKEAEGRADRRGQDRVLPREVGETDVLDIDGGRRERRD